MVNTLVSMTMGEFFDRQDEEGEYLAPRFSVVFTGLSRNTEQG